MSFRIQFSLRTLLLLMLVVGAGLVFVVLPWHHRQQQLAILDRLRNDYGFYVDKRFNSEEQKEEELYTIEISHLQYEELNSELIRLINSCELIGAVHLQFLTGNADQVKDFRRLLQLQKLTELDVSLEKLDEAQVLVLRQLPLKALRITSFESEFQTWPINPDLEEFYFLGQCEATNSFYLSEHQKLRRLELQAIDAQACASVEIRNCPVLGFCDIRLAINDKAPSRNTTLVIEGHPKLEGLQLYYEGFEPTRLVIRELPELTSFGLEGIRWNKIDESPKWRLRGLTYVSDQEVSEQELAAILRYPKLLGLRLSFPHPQREDFAIPELPELQDFCFSYRRTRRMPAALTLQYLRKMPNLQHLDLRLDQLDSALQEQIAKYSELAVLSIDVPADFPAVDFLRQKPKLARMELSCRQFSAAQINFLASLKQIGVLDLHSTANQLTEFQAFFSHPAKYLRFNHQDIKPALIKALASPPADFSEAEQFEKSTP